jgi:HK97 family phage prohead protease
MPYHVGSAGSCPSDKPHAVIKDSDGEVMGCHATEDDAKRQMAALYAQDSLTPAGAKMERKSFGLIEAKADKDTGTFEALVSVFGNVDSVGDRIQPGAFAKSLERWNAAGDPIPVILSHDWQNPWAHIGVVHPGDAKETDRGLFVKGHLDVKDNGVAKQVHRLMQRRSLKEFSFGYKVISEKKGKDGANDLSEIDLIEVGPTLKGANPATELHAVKAAIEEENQPPPPDEAEIRRELERHKAEEATKDVVKAPPGPSQIEQLAEQVDALTQRVEELATAQAEQLKALEAAVEEPKRANSVEQQRLRKEVTQAVVDLHSDGVSFSKPPKQEPEPEREAEWSLKARARREIYDLLSD